MHDERSTLYQPAATSLAREPLAMSDPVPRIDWVEDENAAGELGAIYAGWREKNPGRRMPDILKCFSPRPDVLRQVMQLGDVLHFSEGHLSRKVKESLATYVSGLNSCLY
ncbi:MAG TPA: hypothetical protein VNC50_01690 [Planctomycetia bacterium]|nr:hypothetical protein [Planctomycetia bacterium]